MALKVNAVHLPIQIVQGVADAFTQGSVATALSGRQAYNLKGILFEFGCATTIAALADALNGTISDIVLTVTRRSKTWSPFVNDPDVIFKKAMAFCITTSGAYWWPASDYWKPEIEIPIVEDTLYAQLDSTASGLTVTCTLRLDLELDTISDLDRLNIITRSLS